MALVAWNLSLGAQLSASASANWAFRTLSGIGAFLFLPAGVISLLAPASRVFAPLAWLWPLAAAVVGVQALWALVRGRALRLVVVPIALYDVLAAWVAITRWIEWSGGALPWWTLAPGVAVSSLAAAVFGEVAFPWGAAVLVPVLAPMAPARGAVRAPSP